MAVGSQRDAGAAEFAGEQLPASATHDRPALAGAPPPEAGPALAALRVMKAEPWRSEAVLGHARELAAVCDVAVQPQSAVVSVILGDPEVALAAATACLDAGVKVGCFRPPTVPAGTSRLRLTARASLDADELNLARRVLTDVLRGTSAARR